ncbi:hypothetical protein [Streptococcus dysgalactiae]|uniref:hypothetical protein n=1 Tax=Streptococcus dysgalactiae TaxID=1334 RepID=UPI0001AAB766|nr:hypothetical protein [Streptococcus dysgalactiae]HEP5946909.1 hypothetical protein [Streptococcus pyogenes]KKC16932.1 phage protein [Streptococcus dysgalactiae subsp. equisimilis]MBM6540916.1 hypothetical protein [Streptococcus dysgalactiae subsp. equisimilis]SQF78096.1 phage protein [Streptococcus dysgalactiae subsp. equisimilis]BAH81608.1 phage protein [Streptococcus dysgalactiae subsp. equisimilis GGS_124]
MKTLQLSGKPYPIYEEGKITKTEVRLVGDSGLFIPVELIGDQTAKEADDLVSLALDAFVREYVTKYAVAESVQKVEELSLAQKEIEQNAEQAKATAEAANTQATALKAVIAKSQKMADIQAIFMLTSGLAIDPDVYKGTLELLDKPQNQHTYAPFDIFAVEDKDYEESAGEGNLVFVQVLSEFTYNGEDVKALKTKAEGDSSLFVATYADLIKGKKEE